MKLNLGCGPVQPATWVNMDGSSRAKLAAWLPFIDRLLTKMGILSPTEFGPKVTIHNLCRPLPFRTNSVSCIYAGEVWEHFEYSDAAKLTAECHRVLVPGGVLRVCVPDGVEFWQRYLDLYKTISSQPRTQRSAERLRQHVAMYFKEICTRRLWLGSMGHTHKWQFDDIQLVELFENAGFVKVERRHFHDSRIADISDVERSNFLIVEGVKSLLDNNLSDPRSDDA